MNKILRQEFYRLFDEGITDFKESSIEDKVIVRDILFSSSSFQEKEIIFKNAGIASIGSQLDSILEDLFNDALSDYNVNNIMTRDNCPRHFEENEDDINWRCDYNQRYRDSL